MFKQRVIKDLTKDTKVRGIDPFYAQQTKQFIQDLTPAQSFHFPSEAGLRDLFKKYSGKGVQKFAGELAEDIRLPFEVCWFEFLEKYQVKGKHYMDKHGCLVQELREDVLWLRPCYFHVVQKSWMLSYSSMLFKIGDAFTFQEYADYSRDVGRVVHNNDISALNDMFRTRIKTPHFIPFPNIRDSVDKIHEEWVNQMTRNDGLTSGLVNMGLMLLNCKNIRTVKETNMKVKMTKKGTPKKPVYTYRVLEIFKPGETVKQESSRTGSKKRKHLCRGHFKTFTEDAPLLGKIVGRIWWDSQVRGGNKKGIVAKDYVVKEKI